ALPPGEISASNFLGALADAALEQDSRDLLPAALQADFDHIRTAFYQQVEGQDDAVREGLQAIGLHSPFVDWKLLLRGLHAYYHNDDARAVENWQRLDPERLPARVAAPLLAEVDPAFRSRQPPEAQKALRRQFEGLQGLASVPLLRAVQTTLSSR